MRFHVAPAAAALSRRPRGLKVQSALVEAEDDQSEREIHPGGGLGVGEGRDLGSRLLIAS